MSKDTQLATQPTNQIAVMMQGVIEKGITAENAEAMSKLCELYERMEAKNAERAFIAAFAKMQSEIPVIIAKTEIKNRGKYEKFEDVMQVVSPILRANGFSESFSQTGDDKRITVKCHLSHIAGHSRENEFSVRMSNKSDTATQDDCKASTTAKRNALLQALNIIIRQDIFQSDEADSSIEGSPVTANQAADLRALCEETNSDKAKFLAHAGAESFETIMSSRYEDLAEKLNRKLQ